MALSISAAARNAAVDAVTPLVDGGTVELYSGSKPASPATAASGTLLATFTLPADAFDAGGTSGNAGEATLLGVPLSATAGASGTAGWFRMKDSLAAAVIDGTAGTSGTDLILNTAEITVDGTVDITGGTITMPA